MSNDKNKKHPLQNVLEMSDDFADGVRSYSGRGMGGAHCLGVDVHSSSLGDLFAEVLEQTPEDKISEVAAAFRDMRQDAMGKGTIVYFPRVHYVDDADIDVLDTDEDAPDSYNTAAGR